MVPWKSKYSKYLTPRGTIQRGIGAPMTEIFVYRSKEIHGDTYVYDKTVFENSRNPVVITCKIHGDFSQEANSHLSQKQGCPKCSGLQNKTLSTFIQQAKEVHGILYTYDEVLYTNSRSSVLIGCSKHGTFNQTPSKHLIGQGCPVCANRHHNTLYCFKVVGKPIYKFGITRGSYKCRLRVLSSALNNAVPGNLLQYVASVTSTNPRALETKIHAMDFQNPFKDLSHFDGRTEYREVNNISGILAEFFRPQQETI